MNYEAFAEMMRGCLQMQLGEAYKVEIANIPQNNRNDCIALVVFPLFPTKNRIGRSIDMEIIYQEYLEGNTLEECISNLRTILTIEGDEELYLNVAEKICNWELVKDRIYPMLVTRDGNGRYLDMLVHRPFLNLEIAYHIVVEVDGEEGSVKVTNAINKKWNLTEEEIYSRAMANLENAEYEMVDIRTLIGDLEDFSPEEENKDFLYVLSNKNRSYGAAGILSQKILRMCADKIQGDFYLLPSSVHEMMVVPNVGMVTAGELRKMVTDINREQVLPRERLCDAVFYYDLEAKEVRIAE